LERTFPSFLPKDGYANGGTQVPENQKLPKKLVAAIVFGSLKFSRRVALEVLFL
jgi:hypothetical protein